MTAPHLETVAQLSGFENIFDAVVEAVHEDRGTMTCRIMMCRVMPRKIMPREVVTDRPAPQSSGPLVLETPLFRASVGAKFRIGIRAGDVLLATREPTEISARNIFPGKIVSLESRDVIILARVQSVAEPHVEISVQLTLAARDSLGLAEGRDVWLVIKTHSCHLMAG